MKTNSSLIKKSLGQHYLNNERVLQKICQYISSLPVETSKNNLTTQIPNNSSQLPPIIEIGSGTGWLTRLLLEKSHVLAIEIEESSARQMQHYCKNSLKHSLQAVIADVLTLHLPRLITKHFSNYFSTQKHKPTAIICGNLPYNISSRLIIKLQEDFAKTQSTTQQTTGSNFILIHHFVFLIQKEVAEGFAFFQNAKFSFTRLPKVKKLKLKKPIVGTEKTQSTSIRNENIIKKKCAPSKASYLTAWHCKSKLLLAVAPGSFTPPPKVKSMLLKLQPRKHPPGNIKHYAVYKFLTEVTFSQRRKQCGSLLVNALQALSQNDCQGIVLKKSLMRLQHFLKKKKLKTSRADALLPYHYALLARFLCRE